MYPHVSLKHLDRERDSFNSAVDDEKVVKDSFSELGDAAGDNDGAIDEEDARFLLSALQTVHSTQKKFIPLVPQLGQQMARP